MADFKIQRISTQITNGNTTKVLTAGVDYDAPSAASKAFARIVSTFKTGTHASGDQTAGPREYFVSITNPSNIATSLTLARGNSTNDVDVELEIIEYTGTAGGANEFIVRSHQAISISSSTSSLTHDGSAVSGIVNDADVVVFLCGHSTDNAGRALNDNLYATEWLSGSDTPRVQRGSTTGANDTVTVAVVEFTGSNWTVQRVVHAYTATTLETETITAVGALSRAFIHPQFRTTSTGNLDDCGQEAWLSATDTVSFQLQSGAETTSTGVVWVISNAQTDGTPMVVRRYNGTGTTGQGASATNVTVTAVSDLAISAIMGETTKSSGTGDATGRNSVSFNFTSTTNVKLEGIDTSGTRTYRFETVEWPTVAAVGGETATPGVGSILLTAFAPVVSATANVAVTVGAAGLTLTAFAPLVSVSNEQVVEPGAAALSITGFAPTVSAGANVEVTPGTAALVLTGPGTTVSVSDHQTVEPGVASLDVTGFAPTATATANVEAEPGTAALTVTGLAPTVSVTANVSAAPGVASLTVTGFAPTVTTTANQTVVPGLASIVLTGFSPTVQVGDQVVVEPNTGALTLTGFAPVVTATANVSVTPGLASLTLTGFAGSVSTTDHVVVTPGVGVITVTGYAPTVNQGFKEFGYTAITLTPRFSGSVSTEPRLSGTVVL